MHCYYCTSSCIHVLSIRFEQYGPINKRVTYWVRNYNYQMIRQTKEQLIGFITIKYQMHCYHCTSSFIHELSIRFWTIELLGWHKILILLNQWSNNLFTVFTYFIRFYHHPNFRCFSNFRMYAKLNRNYYIQKKNVWD